jgi:Trk-type K+ transport system membrane component
VDLNTSLVLVTTLVLLSAGTLFFRTTESAALQEHEGAGRWMAALFCSMTPRTAGFNNIDMALLSKEGILLTLLLMWIGASPGSTGGGIKTSTVAVAAMAVYHYARGREHMEFAKREIAQDSVLRAFVIITMSLVFIGLASFAVTWFDPVHSLEEIVFECVSAFSTAGLSLGITSSLSGASKAVLILTMFFGRVGVFTLLLGLVRRAPHAKLHRFPVERVIIT